MRIMRRTPKGRALVEEDPYPLQKVEDHLWRLLTLSLAEATSQKDFDARVQNFCEVFNVHPSAVAQRFKELEEAIEERPNATVH